MNPKSEYPYVEGKGLYPGLPWNQHLGGVLVAMGLPRSEFETASMKGYGHPSVDGSQRAAMSPGSVEGGQAAAVYCGVNGDALCVKVAHWQLFLARAFW